MASLSGVVEAFPFLETSAWESNLRFSPDGSWIAYASNETGQWEVLIDRHFIFRGFVGDTTQRLSWPRSGLVDRNHQTILQTELPRDLVDATAELARALLTGDRTADNAAEAEGLEKLVAGPIELTFRGSVGPKPIPDSVWYLLEQWGTETSRTNIAVPLVRA